MKLKITTLVIIEGNQVENIYHSLEDNQDKAYQDLINQVNATYGDGGILQFKNIKGIKNYFDSVTIETQELIPIGFKNTLVNRETKWKRIQEPSIHHQDKWNEHFPTPGKPNPKQISK